jgi:hypothetical protein
MKMRNVHERTIAAPAARVGALLDTLASVDDKFWPHENWPGVKFKRGRLPEIIVGVVMRDGQSIGQGAAEAREART